jgi:hypothetical protein
MTIASSLAGGVLRPSEQIDCMQGSWTVVEGERPIKFFCITVVI